MQVKNANSMGITERVAENHATAVQIRHETAVPFQTLRFLCKNGFVAVWETCAPAQDTLPSSGLPADDLTSSAKTNLDTTNRPVFFLFRLFVFANQRIIANQRKHSDFQTNVESSFPHNLLPSSSSCPRHQAVFFVKHD